MEHVHEGVYGARYYWEYLKRFGKESFETWRKDFVIAFLLAIIPVFLAWGDLTALESGLLGAEATILLYSIFALRHLIHTSLILFRERAHPEYGGIHFTHWVYGIWGASILLALVGGISYGTFHGFLRKSPTVVLRLPAMIPPTIHSQIISSPIVKGDHKASKPSPQNDISQAIAPSINHPSQPPPQVSQSAPITFLDRVVQENRGLTPHDRDQLSKELYDCDQFIKQSQAVGYKLNTEFGKLSNDRQSGALAKDVDDHIKFLHDLDASAWDQYHGLQRFQEKWQYFQDQTEYVFGDNPFNKGEGLLLNAEQGMAGTLSKWSKISNRDQRDMLDLEAQEQVNYEQNLHDFFNWINETLERIKQMRQSLDPNGVVQPIPSKTVAPALGMFSFRLNKSNSSYSQMQLGKT
jgi:hypothetical protein